MKPLFLDDEIAENQRSDLESALAPSQSQDEAPSPESKKLQVQDQNPKPSASHENSAPNFGRNNSTRNCPSVGFSSDLQSRQGTKF
jgi:hypothetical protein